MTPSSSLTPDLFCFLREIKTHNNREWFARNKDRFQTAVRDPFLGVIADLRLRLRGVSPHFIVDPSPVGGSMTRIYRDLRFSKDKSPYKVSISAHFRHAHGKEGMTPALYLHLEPGRSSAGGGLWQPPPEGLRLIRQAIVTRTQEWKKAVSGRSFRMGCGMAGESLRRPPPGFDPEHPFIEDIKRKDFATSVPLKEKDLLRSDPVDTILKGYRSVVPFVRFIVQALGLPF
ncbi:MAG TPA: TIGR02453 family protein [Planctomycetota bacterium]|nr:TIGR02453 family protein [Planctomycetota bacterium]